MSDDKKQEIVKNRPFGSNGRIQGRSGGLTTFSDPSDTYANEWDNFIQFTSVISGESVKFKAFLTEFTDEYQSEWNSEQVYGRNDPIQTFRNTTRTINLGWDCPAGSVGEARVNMRAASELIRMLYPGYLRSQNVTTINKSPVIKVKFRNFIKSVNGDGLYVTLSGVSFSPDLEAGFFDHDEENKSEPKEELMPKLLRFSCTMTVLHRDTIGWDASAQWPSDLESFPNLPKVLSGMTSEDLRSGASAQNDAIRDQSALAPPPTAAKATQSAASDIGADTSDSTNSTANKSPNKAPTDTSQKISMGQGMTNVPG